MKEDIRLLSDSHQIAILSFIAYRTESFFPLIISLISVIVYAIFLKTQKVHTWVTQVGYNYRFESNEELFDTSNIPSHEKGSDLFPIWKIHFSTDIDDLNEKKVHIKNQCLTKDSI